MTIVYYVSSHGLGHAVRAIEVMRRLPARMDLWIKSAAPPWFFRQELGRPFRFLAETFDCGPAEAGDLSIDREASLRAAAEMAARNAGRLQSEAQWLRSVGAALVVSDVPSFPLAAAREAGVAGAIVANFTWLEIFQPYAVDFPRQRGLIDALEAEYSLADTAFVTPLDVPMRAFKNVRRTPLVARRGVPRRGEIAEALGLDPQKRWFLFYPGNLGVRFDWTALERLGESVFLTFQKPEGAAPGNLVCLDQGGFRHQDVVASVDGAVSKPGYGLVGECMVNATPLLYSDREHFAEFEAMDRALEAWGGAVRLTREAFAAGRWGEALEALVELRPKPLESADGAEVIARELAALAEGV
jgi:hypothetical protein